MKYYLQIKNNEILSSSNLPVEDKDIRNKEISKKVFVGYNSNPEKYYIDNEQIKTKSDEEIEEQEFNIRFFNTSLGYIRRAVTMKDGSIKDFLCDILPLLQVGIPVLTYTRDLKQSKVLVTEEFLEECKQQLLTDFYGG